ncbi:MAG: hypothetical protein HYV45_01025 [Candidatus Moranbacteria bacterium]|nr:hypothetical protein [Candidatus Moranbacteria bacterium]
MKKVLEFLGVMIIGPIVVIAIDVFFDVSFKEDVNRFAQTGHNIAHMLWGGIIARLLGCR